MRLSRLVIGCYLIATAGLASFPSTALAQSRPTLDPKIPAYIPQQPASGTLSISGSTIVKPLVQAWVNELMRRHPRLKITVSTDASEAGLAALLAHRTGMAAMSRRLTASEIAEFVREYGYEPTEVPVAGDAMAIFVNKDNPVTGLSLDELDAMFCRERRRGLAYAIDSWGLVGVMDEWFEAPVQLYGRNGKSSLGYFFREEVCKDGTFHPQLVDADGSASVVLDVGRDQYGIGFSAISYGTSMVKPVPIAFVKGGRYVEPSIEAVMDGSYPLRRNLYLYVAKPPKTAPSQESAELVRYVLSRQGQQLARDLGYLPLSFEEITRVTSRWSPTPKAAKLERRGRLAVG